MCAVYFFNYTENYYYASQLFLTPLLNILFLLYMTVNTNLRELMCVVNENKKKITNRHQHYLSHVQTFLTDTDEYRG